MMVKYYIIFNEASILIESLVSVVDGVLSHQPIRVNWVIWEKLLLLFTTLILSNLTGCFFSTFEYLITVENTCFSKFLIRYHGFLN